MTKFACSYAYNVSCYLDFTVEAESEQEAEHLIQAALKAGRFNDVECDVYWDNVSDHRVFVQGEADDFGRGAFPSQTMADLLGEEPVTPIV